MLIPFFSSKSRSRTKPTVPVAERLQTLAEDARAEGDLARAAEYYRAALEHAPLDRTLRRIYAEVLLETASEKPATKKSSAPSTAVFSDLELESEPEAPKFKARSLAKAPPNKKPNPGMAEWDEENSLLAAIKPPRASERPKNARRSKTPVSPKSSPRMRAPVWAMAALFTGIVLVLAGLAHGLLAKAMGSVALPDVPVEVKVPDELTKMLDQAQATLSTDSPEKSLATLDKAEAAFPEQADLIRSARVQTLRVIGSRSLEKRDYTEAIKQFEEATQLDPLNKDNWIELARAFREQGRTRQSRNLNEGHQLLARAASAYERALDVQKDDPAALVGLGQVYSFLNERSKAVDYYHQVIRVAPDSPEACIAHQHLSQLTGQG